MFTEHNQNDIKNNNLQQNDILVMGVSERFSSYLSRLFTFDSRITKPHYDIVLIGPEETEFESEVYAQILVCPRGAVIKGAIKCNSAVSYGMETTNTVSFTSIGADRAMISINRNIKYYEKEYDAAERPVEFQKGLSIEENLALQCLNILAI